MSDPQLKQAIALMEGYAQRTGLISDQPRHRYLWTDAFAVCNFLGLARATGEQRFQELALRLVEQTHHSLGRHREDDARSGWISGLDAAEGESHPTRGGLRIGKDLPERRPDERLDEQLEWERDGQYFHYLTKWMHALDQLGRVMHEPRFQRWASELAITAQRAFVYRRSLAGTPAMHWKMSIDLTRPLVAAMGQHDPLDGYITVMQLHSNASTLHQDTNIATDLQLAARQFAAMLDGAELRSVDPLGIGGLLVDAYRAAQLMRQGTLMDPDLLERLLSAALDGLQIYARSGDLQAAARYRLAFRELGLAVGIHAVQRLPQLLSRHDEWVTPATRQHLDELNHYLTLGEQIVSFWRQPEQQRSSSWREHRDINEVMLATSFIPDGFLDLNPPD